MPVEPVREWELPVVLAVGMDGDVACVFRLKQVHCIGEHDCSFVEMKFMWAIRLPGATLRWRLLEHEAIKIHAVPPSAEVTRV